MSEFYHNFEFKWYFKRFIIVNVYFFILNIEFLIIKDFFIKFL